MIQFIIQRQAYRFFTPVLAGFAVLIGALSFFPQLAEANQFKRIRDVNVACSAALACDIYITNPRVTLQTFGFRRAASRVGDASVYLSMREPLQAGSEVQFLVDGVEIARVAASALSYRAAAYEYTLREQRDVLALLNAARRGSTLQISYTTKAGRSTAPFSLSGMVAGLIFADEAQGRIGRDDALMALTADPATTAVDNLSTVTLDYKTWADVPKPLLAYFGTDDHLCANAIGAPNDAVFYGSQTEIAAGVALVELACGTPGAYNFPSAFWLKRGDVFVPLPLPMISEKGLSAEFQAWNAAWDSQTATLVSFFKGRGIGDCGTFAEWKLHADAPSYAFILVSMRQKDECDGVQTDDFSDYKQVWPKQ
ncbi:MAG: DUF1176 domain-containing protein [Ahrensia sp.]|nr:DUF1176 domain-containing protein [Ahrensia sp.]